MTSETDVTDAQIAGLVLAVGALIGEIRRKGLVDAEDVENALSGVADDIRNSKLAQATPGDRLIGATLSPIDELRRLNSIYDPESGGFPDWMSGGD